jgi:hypothetical protein
MFGVIAEFLPKTADQYVDGAVEGFPIDTACLIDDSVPAQDPAAIPDKQSQ